MNLPDEITERLEQLRQENEELRSQLDKYRLSDEPSAEAAQREEARLELQRAKEMAENSSRLKSEFLSQISHEIRTPLNTILSFASLIRYELEELLSDDLKESFRFINNGGKRLIRTIDLILNMSELKTGNYELQPSVIDLHRDILHNLHLEFTCMAESKDLSFTLKNTACDTILEADGYTLTQIFSNLIDNAIKFTDSGSVDIRIYNQPDGRLSVEVKDTGIGISEDYRAKLYTPFSQEETGYRRRYEGNGLGLSLVKKCCDLNCAVISVETEKGKGSCFTVTFEKKSILSPVSLQ